MLMLILFITAMSWMSPSPCMEMSARQLRDNVEMAFNRLDTNKDGVLTREEFVNSCLMVSIIKLNILGATCILKYFAYLNILFSGSQYLSVNGKLPIQTNIIDLTDIADITI